MTDNPLESVSFMEQGKFKIKQHEFKLAEEAFLKEVAQNPNNAEAWFLITACRKKLYRFDEALEPIEKAVEVEPANPDYLYELALTYKSIGKIDKALETVRKLGSLTQDRYDTKKLLELWEKK
ncbi:MAG: tetratricopeptide repeat protein [Candidatus Hodarchaeales archaeon]|jgi:tetratricopeptide (TPR) repeat protein